MIRLRTLRPLAALLLVSTAVGRPLAAQPEEPKSAAEIALALKKLTVVGSALYVAAHPDDENTAFLAYLSRERLVRTTYLSMTRGDGGQNLIGTEKGDLMGLLRTQELLAARRIDGAEQTFSRAIDFGFSKGPDETLRIWGREAALADVVWAIRRVRPDVIVTRFPTTGEGGHGHHTSSAILAEEAFTAAADPKRFPEQLAYVEPWQAKRLLWNVFRFGANAPRKEVAGQIAVDLGAYNALLGRSYTEIAALSRSMHKSQGFGSAERRGTWLNDFQPRLGEPAAKDLFDGVDLSWSRVPGGAAMGPLLDAIYRSFDPRNPAASIPALLDAHARMAALSGPDVERKRKELAEVIRSCAGLWVEAIVPDDSATPGSSVTVAALALNRSSVPMTLETVEVTHQADVAFTPAPLKPNEPVKAEVKVVLPATLDDTTPYWLRKPPAKGLYTVDDPTLVGRPESPAPLVARFTVKAGDQRLSFETPVLYRTTDPVKGELYRPFEVTPPITIAFDEKVYLFAGSGAKRLRLTVRAGEPNVAGTLRLKMPAGWAATPAGAPFSLKEKGDEATVTFDVVPPGTAGTVTLAAEADLGARTVSRELVRVDYPHIPVQTLFPPAEVKAVRLDVTRGKAGAIGYVMGSGDDLPGGLRQLGYTVTLLSDDDLETADLSRFTAIVAGIRAYNTRPRLKVLNRRLLDYVEKGGRYVVQYQTTNDLVVDAFGPYPFKLSRERVTVEEAPVTAVPNAVLAGPNRIAAADFDGWVQERGLYFAGTWDAKYETPLSSHDPDEPERKGGLLVARYGKGTFTYTGYAFFRQIPAGVPGAIRLFVNLLEAK